MSVGTSQSKQKGPRDHPVARCVRKEWCRRRWPASRHCRVTTAPTEMQQENELYTGQELRSDWSCWRRHWCRSREHPLKSARQVDSIILLLEGEKTRTQHKRSECCLQHSINDLCSAEAFQQQLAAAEDGASLNTIQLFMVCNASNEGGSTSDQHEKNVYMCHSQCNKNSILLLHDFLLVMTWCTAAEPPWECPPPSSVDRLRRCAIRALALFFEPKELLNIQMFNVFLFERTGK